jgi:hypothetical protein
LASSPAVGAFVWATAETGALQDVKTGENAALLNRH